MWEHLNQKDAFTYGRNRFITTYGAIINRFSDKAFTKYVISDEEAVMIKQGKQIAVKEDEGR